MHGPSYVFIFNIPVILHFNLWLAPGEREIKQEITRMCLLFFGCSEEVNTVDAITPHQTLSHCLPKSTKLSWYARGKQQTERAFPMKRKNANDSFPQPISIRKLFIVRPNRCTLRRHSRRCWLIRRYFHFLRCLSITMQHLNSIVIRSPILIYKWKSKCKSIWLLCRSIALCCVISIYSNFLPCKVIPKSEKQRRTDEIMPVRSEPRHMNL